MASVYLDRPKQSAPGNWNRTHLAHMAGAATGCDVLIMCSDDTEGDYFLVTQGKTGQKLRILMRTEAGENSLGRLVREITERNACHPSKYLLINKYAKRMTKGMLRLRWDKAREKAQQKAIDQGDPVLAAKIGGFQFRDIRPKAASEIVDIGDASLLLGHSKQEITKRVYRRIGATAKPSK